MRVGTRLIILPLFSLLGGVACAEELRGVWHPLAPLPTARQEVGVAQLDGSVYVIGGLINGGATATVEVLRTDTGEWETTAPLPLALHHVAAAAAADRIYSIGGFVGFTFNPTDAVYELDPETGVWTTRASLPDRRGALAAATIDGKIYVVGGDGPPGDLSRFSVYDPQLDEWTELPPMPTPREHLAAAAIGKKLYAVGGRSPNRNRLEVFDTESGKWALKTPMPTARSGLAAAAFSGHLFVFGGEIPAVYDETEVYDPVTDTWFELTPMAVPRHGIGAAVVGNRIIIPGGAVVAGFAETDAADEFVLLEHSLAIPQYAEGAQVDAQVFATNTSDLRATLLLELYDDHGAPLESQLQGPGGPDRILELQPLEVARWSNRAAVTSGETETRVGWALLFSDQPLTGHALFGGSGGFAGVLGASPGMHFLIPVISSQDENPGLAVANASRFPAHLTFLLRDSGAAELATAQLDLDPYGHRALFLDELFPGIDLSDFTGSVEGVSDQATAAMAILQRASTRLATLPTRTGND